MFEFRCDLLIVFSLLPRIYYDRLYHILYPIGLALVSRLVHLHTSTPPPLIPNRSHLHQVLSHSKCIT